MATVDKSELNPVMFDIRELKADICGFSRSLQNSLGAYHRDLKMLPGGTSIAEHAMGPNKVFVGSRGYSIRSTRKKKQRCKTGRTVAPITNIDDTRGASKKKSSDLRRAGGGNNNHDVHRDEGGAAGIIAGLLKPTTRRPRRTAKEYWHNHTRSAGFYLHGGDGGGFGSGCGNGERGSSVRTDYYGGIGRGGGGRAGDDTEDILLRVLASTTAVAGEKEAAVEAKRIEEDKTCRLLQGLWEAEAVKLRWMATVEKSKVVRKRLESTSRIVRRQKEQIRKLQAAETDAKFSISTSTSIPTLLESPPFVLHHSTSQGAWMLPPPN